MYATTRKKALRLVPVVRVSSPKQEHGTSLETQREMIEEFAKQRGYELITKEDGSFWCENKAESAWGKKDRTDFERAFKLALQPHVDGMLVYQVDRFSREGAGKGLQRIAKLKERSKHLISVMEESIDTSGPHGELVLTMLLAMAKFNNEMRAASAMRGQQYLKERDYWIGGKPGYGWKKHRTVSTVGKNRYKVVPNEKELVWLDKMVEMNNAGLRPVEIADKLNELGCPRESGTYKWRSQRVGEILRPILAYQKRVRDESGLDHPTDPRYIEPRAAGQHYLQWGAGHDWRKQLRQETAVRKLQAEYDIETG